MRPFISSPIVHTPASSAVSKDNDKNTSKASPLAAVQVNREQQAYEGLHIFFGAGKKINGQTHSERIRSAAQDNDLDKLTEMILPGAENTDSLRKLSTAAGGLIDAKYAKGTEVKATSSPEAERNYQFLGQLMARYETGKMDPEGKRQLIQGLAYRAYTSPILQTADGRTITFGQLGTTSTWNGVTQKDLSNSNIAQKLDPILSDLQKVYEIAASCPQNKSMLSTTTYFAKDKGLRKLWKETQKGNFSSEMQRQTGKFTHKAASFLKAKPYVNSTLNEVFSLELRFLRTRDREYIEKKIIENQVHATIKQLESRPNDPTPSPGRIAKEVKQKSNYRHLAYPDKDAYLAEFIKQVRTPPPVAEQPMQDVEQATEPSEEPEYSHPDLQEARKLWHSHMRALNIPIE